MHTYKTYERLHSKWIYIPNVYTIQSYISHDFTHWPIKIENDDVLKWTRDRNGVNTCMTRKHPIHRYLAFFQWNVTKHPCLAAKSLIQACMSGRIQ